MPFVEPPGATALLVTGRDTPAEWLQAGQALHRLLLRAAHDGVFASLHSQPLELALLRTALRNRLHIRGAPQMVLQFSAASTSRLTARRPTGNVMLA
jgi:DNA-binding GntR family transcriptional regulator